MPETRHLRPEAQHDPLVGLDPDRQQVRVGLDGRVPEQPMRDFLELDRDLGGALRQPLARAEVERDARPAPVVDLEVGGDVRLGLRFRVDLRLLAVAGDRLAGDPARAVLATDDVLADLVRRHLADRPDHLDLLVAEGVGIERRRRLHRHEAHQLEQVVLEEVAAGARLLVERAAVLDPDRLGDGDLDMVDVAAVPDRLEDPVAEPEDEEVADRLLAEVVIDPIDLRLAEDLADLAVEPDRRLEVVAEGLLDDDPSPAAVVLLVVESDPAQLGDDLGERRRLGREVEEVVAAAVLLAVDRLERLGQPVEAGRIARSRSGGSGSATRTTARRPRRAAGRASTSPARPGIRPGGSRRRTRAGRSRGARTRAAGGSSARAGTAPGRPCGGRDRRSLRTGRAMLGSGTRSRRRPSRSGLSSCLWRLAAGRSRRRRSRIVRGASFGRGAGYGCSCRARLAAPRRARRSSGVDTPAFGSRRLGHGRYSVFTAWPPNSLRSAASTFAPYESSWRDRKRVSSESVITGAGTSWSIASWTVQRPSPESGDVALDVLEVRAVRLNARRGELEQPRPDHGALHPQLRDRGEVELVRGRVHDLEAFGVGLHEPVLDPVVDHLHVVPGTRAADVEVAALRRQGLEDRLERLDGLTVAADHQAVPDLEPPDPAARPGIDVVDAPWP